MLITYQWAATHTQKRDHFFRATLC